MISKPIRVDLPRKFATFTVTVGPSWRLIWRCRLAVALIGLATRILRCEMRLEERY